MKNATLTELDRQNKKLHHIDGKMTEVRGNERVELPVQIRVVQERTGCSQRVSILYDNMWLLGLLERSGGQGQRTASCLCCHGQHAQAARSC